MPDKWDGISGIRYKLREYMLKNEQNMQCAYCESTINCESSKSHIDHFKRKHHFPELTFDYKNLFVSCNSHSHCASHKDEFISKDKYEMLVNPAIENPDQYFDYSISGKIISKNDKAGFTERTFNLNHPSLKQQRKDIAFSVLAYRDTLELREVVKEIGAFESFIRAIW